LQLVLELPQEQLVLPMLVQEMELRLAQVLGRKQQQQMPIYAQQTRLCLPFWLSCFSYLLLLPVAPSSTHFFHRASAGGMCSSHLHARRSGASAPIHGSHGEVRPLAGK